MAWRVRSSEWLGSLHQTVPIWSTCPAIRKSLLQHDAMHNAPRNIECDQDDDKPVEERLVVLEWEKVGCDNHKNKCPNEKRGWLYAATSQESLLDETAKIMRIEWNGF